MAQNEGKIASKVTAIYRYPVKGLTPEPLQRVTLTVGQTLPFDRAYAIENGRGRFDAAAPVHLPKVNFLMLMRNERLATIESHFDDQTTELTLLRDGKPVARGRLDSPTGRTVIEQFFGAYFKSELRGAPHIVEAPGHSFSDVAKKCLHIVNLASIRDLQRALGRKITPLRFRPNIIFDSEKAWEELSWIGRTIEAGNASLKVFKRTERCAAVNVDPGSGDRNMDIPAVLARNWKHTDFGIYAEVTSGGTLTVGDAFVPPIEKV